MTDKPENPPAFPRPHSEDSFNEDVAIAQRGMPLRDYFAAHAPVMTDQWWEDSKGINHHWLDAQAAFSYKYADAMLKAREL